MMSGLIGGVLFGGGKHNIFRSDLVEIVWDWMSLDEIQYGLVGWFVLVFVFHSELNLFGFYFILGYLKAETRVSL